MVRSLRELEWREEKGEERGFARRGRCAGGRVPKRRKQDWGVQYGDESEDREPTGCQEKGKRTVHEYGGCDIMLWLHEDGVLMVPNTDGIRRARDNGDRRA